jgi:hypothetical protein
MQSAYQIEIISYMVGTQTKNTCNLHCINDAKKKQTQASKGFQQF